MFCAADTTMVADSKNKGKFSQGGPSLREGTSAHQERCILSRVPAILNTNDPQYVSNPPVYIKEM